MWEGQTARMDTRKWAKIATEWTTSEGKMKKRQIKKKMKRRDRGKTWENLDTLSYSDRVEWKSLSRPSASSGTNG